MNSETERGKGGATGSSLERAEALMKELCAWFEDNQETAPLGVVELVEDEIVRLSTMITIRKNLRENVELL